MVCSANQMAGIRAGTIVKTGTQKCKIPRAYPIKSFALFIIPSISILVREGPTGTWAVLNKQKMSAYAH